jgi:hypothetical protein
MCDATGIIQFMNAVAELARGLPAPTITPAWSRELLDAQSPPTPSFPHREHDAGVPQALPPTPTDVADMVRRSFLFGPSNVATLKKLCLPPHLRDMATSFDVLAAVLWRARTAALGTLRPSPLLYQFLFVLVRCDSLFVRSRGGLRESAGSR